MNIYEKMLAITADLKNVAKNLQVGEGRSSYKAVGEADVLAAVKPLEEKYKVYSYPMGRTIIESDILSTTTEYNGTTKTMNKMFMRLEVIYRFVNIEKPDEFIDIATYGDGIDTQDKAPGKAMTYADKYALLKAYKITTGEDPDQGKSDEGEIEKSSTNQQNKNVSQSDIKDFGAPPLVPPLYIQTLKERLKRDKVTESSVLKKYGLSKFEDFNMEIYQQCNVDLNAYEDKLRAAEIKAAGKLPKETDLGL